MQFNTITHNSSQYKRPENSVYDFEAQKALKNKRNNVSFGFSGVTNVLSTLESNPVLALAVIDFFGMILPRTLIDLNRNKEELGHLNWDAGRETIMREVFSSGMLFFGPGLLFTAVGNKLLKSVYNNMGINTTALTNYETLSALETKVKDILKSESLKTVTKDGTKLTTKYINVTELRQAVAKALLEDVSAFSSAAGKPVKLSEELISEFVKEVGKSSEMAKIDRIVTRSSKSVLRPEFKRIYKDTLEKLQNEALAKGMQDIDKIGLKRQAVRTTKELLESTMIKTRAAIRKVALESKDRNISKFLSEFTEKATKHLQEHDTILSVNGAKPVSSNISTIARDIFTTTDDIIAKAANGADQIKLSQLESGIDKVFKSFKTFKAIKTAIPVAVIFTALVTFPKFSAWLTKKLNGGKDMFPGLAGLKDEPKDRISFSNTLDPHNKPVKAEQPQPQPVTPAPTEVPSYITAKNIFNEFERGMNR